MEQQSVDSVINTFFAFSCVGKQTPTRSRYLRVALQLRRYLEAEGADSLRDEDAALLELERSVEPEGAFARLFGPEELVYALSGFLQPEWLLPDLQDRRTQVSLTPRFIQWLCNSCLLDSRQHLPAIRSARAAAALARKGPALRRGAGGSARTGAGGSGAAGSGAAGSGAAGSTGGSSG